MELFILLLGCGKRRLDKKLILREGKVIRKRRLKKNPREINSYKVKLGLIILIFLIFSLFGNAIVSSQSFITSSSIKNPEGCTYRWFCSDWNPADCPKNQIQTRKCTNAGDCSDDFDKPEEKQSCRYTIPKQLFDIKLELESDTIYNSYQLTAWIKFESFGREPTPVNLTYIILDKEESIVYTKEDYIVVETERFVVESFEGLNLGPGEYVLVLKTLYNVEVEDEFRQEFKIEEEFKISWPMILAIFIGGVIIIFVVDLLMRWYEKVKESK